MIIADDGTGGATRVDSRGRDSTNQVLRKKLVTENYIVNLSKRAPLKGTNSIDDPIDRLCT